MVTERQYYGWVFNCRLFNSENGEYSSYSIGELFAGTELDWRGQLVKLVFHYDKQRFVVMTTTNLFVLEYDHFRVGPKNRLVYSSNETQFTKMRNCLLPKNCADGSLYNNYIRSLVTRSTMLLLVVSIVIIFALLL